MKFKEELERLNINYTHEGTEITVYFRSGKLKDFVNRVSKVICIVNELRGVWKIDNFAFDNKDSGEDGLISFNKEGNIVQIAIARKGNRGIKFMEFPRGISKKL
jgi:hypothetical protein